MATGNGWWTRTTRRRASHIHRWLVGHPDYRPARGHSSHNSAKSLRVPAAFAFLLAHERDTELSRDHWGDMELRNSAHP